VSFPSVIIPKGKFMMNVKKKGWGKLISSSEPDRGRRGSSREEGDFSRSHQRSQGTFPQEVGGGEENRWRVERERARLRHDRRRKGGKKRSPTFLRASSETSEGSTGLPESFPGRRKGRRVPDARPRGLKLKKQVSMGSLQLVWERGGGQIITV